MAPALAAIRARLGGEGRLAEGGRFFLVALGGLGIDIGLAWALIALAGVPDAVGAAVGFATATVVNYVAHQLWTFREGSRRLSLRRFLAFVAVVGVVFAVRLGALAVLGAVLPGGGLAVPVRLTLAAGVSFLVALPLNRLLVFREPVA